MKYSVITPVFNREDCIVRCIDSVVRNLNDEEDYLEHIIVNDGSEDDTEKMVKCYAEKYPHIQYITFPENRGTNAARNAAISIAKGDYCIILDSDDYFTDNAIEMIDEIMKRNPSFRYYLFTSNDRLKYCEQTATLCKPQTIVTYQDFLLEKVVGDFIHVIETSVLKNFPFDEEFRIYEGVFFMRFYKEVQQMLFSKLVITIRERSRSDSVSRTTFRTNKVVIRKRLKSLILFKEWFETDLKRMKTGLVLVTKLYNQILENELLCGDYMAAKQIITIKGLKLHYCYKLVYYLRLGLVYRIIIYFYLFLKYRLLQRKIE